MLVAGNWPVFERPKLLALARNSTSPTPLLNAPVKL